MNLFFSRTLPVMVLAVMVWLVPGGGLYATEPVFTTFHLDNGMEVIAVPNHRIPAVNHTLWFRVGSADDPPGKSGLAHYLEHMMFQGTRDVAPREYSRRVAALGGRQNAFTSRDYTGYYVTIAKDYLSDVMRLEADRMQHLAPPAQEFLRERQVILEERRMVVDNKPSSRFAERMDIALYQTHPYHDPIIGLRSEMEGLTQDDVMAFYRRYYHPNNALLIVTGDVTPEEVQTMAEHYYGGIPRAEISPRRWPGEAKHAKASRAEMRDANVKQSLWSRYYLAPSLAYGDTKQALPLIFLNQLLGGGESSRLYQSLVVEKKLATDINTDYSPLSVGPAKFILQVTPRDIRQTKALGKALAAELQKLQKNGISDEEMARCRTQLKAELIYARDGLQPVSNILGQLRLVGRDAEFFNQWPERVDAVTKQQVLAAAKSVLVESQSVTGLLLPEKGADRAAK